MSDNEIFDGTDSIRARLKANWDAQFKAIIKDLVIVKKMYTYCRLDGMNKERLVFNLIKLVLEIINSGLVESITLVIGENEYMLDSRTVEGHVLSAIAEIAKHPDITEYQINHY